MPKLKAEDLSRALEERDDADAGRGRSDLTAEVAKKGSNLHEEPEGVTYEVAWEALSRDGYACVVCKSKDDLVVQRIRGGQNGRPATVRQVITLCLVDSRGEGKDEKKENDGDE